MPTVPIRHQGIHQTRHFCCLLAIPTALISIIICGCPQGIPPELIELGVKKGEELYEKRLLIDLQEVPFPCEDTWVRDIRRVNDSDKIAILTGCAVIHYDLNSDTITSQKALNPNCDPAQFVDIESDGSLEVFCDHWHSTNGFGLLDAEGEILWLKDDETLGQVSNLKDLDGDGSLDFCARFEQSLACFNVGTGDELWRETGTQYYRRYFSSPSIVVDETTYVLVTVCSVPSDDHACDSVGPFLWEIRNGHGTLIERIALRCDEAIDELCYLTREKFQDGAVQLVHGPPLRFVDADNNFLTAPQTPPSAWQWRIEDVAVLPSLDGRVQIGVIWHVGPQVFFGPGALFNSWRRYLLRIHNGGGDVVYEEVLGVSSFRFWTLDEGSSTDDAQPFLLSAPSPLSRSHASELYLYQPTAPALDTMANKDSLSGSSR